MPSGAAGGFGDPRFGDARSDDPRFAGRARPGGPSAGDPWTGARSASATRLAERPGGPRPDAASAGADPRRVVIGDPAGGGDGPRHARRDDPDEEPRRKRRRTGRQRLLLAVGSIVVVFCLLGLSVAAWAMVKINNIERINLGDELAEVAAGEPKNFLVVGIDTRDGNESLRNTDTIMVVRIDPQSDRMAITSLNRDLMVTIADTGEIGMINSAFARDTGGEQNLIATIQQNFDIPIHHYVGVNFDSFQRVVDSIGGLPVWMPTAARDDHSGFYNEELGCVVLNGDQALALARSRFLEIQDEDGDWISDGSADINRVRRQQIVVQRAMADALSEVRSNPLRLTELVNIGTSTVALDQTIGLGDIMGLAERFKGFDASALEMYALPVLDYPPDPNRLLLDEANAEEMLNVFRGLAPGEIRPGLVTVQVVNGTMNDPAERGTLATDVSGALQQIGFQMAAPDDAEAVEPQTRIEVAPGQQAHGLRVARHITMATPIPVTENPDLASGTVRLIAGLDFATIHQDATPIEAMPGAAPPAPTEPAPGGEAPTEPAPAPAPAPVPEEQPHGSEFVIGEPPEGATC